MITNEALPQTDEVYAEPGSSARSLGRRGRRMFGIEVKAEKGKLSPEQVKFGRLCMKNGGEYVVACSINDVVKYGL